MVKLDSKIAVIIVTYNRSAILAQAIASVQKQTFSPKHIIVVDNASSDDTVEVIESFANIDHRIHMIKAENNLGYGGGLHLGMSWAVKNLDTDYYWMMDDDSFPVPGALKLLLENIEKTGYDLLAFTGFKLGIGTRNSIKPQFGTADADFVLIDTALIRTSVVRKTGPPSVDYFMMCEDYEFSLRLKKMGFRVGVLANDHVQRLHLGSQKFSHATLWRGYYHARNHMLILKKHFSLASLLNYMIIQAKYIWGSFQADDRWLRIGFRLKGLWHGIKSIKGQTLDPATLKFPG